MGQPAGAGADGDVTLTTGRVVLLHGIARRAASLARMERALQAAGFQTRNVNYPSRRFHLDALAEYVHEHAGAFMAGTADPLHFVTHSMGGLVARVLIERHRPAALGSVVMLAPPNQGSELADLLGRFRLYHRFFGPAGAQLGTVANPHYPPCLGAANYAAGIIAGTRSLDPLGWLLLPRPNDGKVSVASTRMVGMTGHLTLPVTHALMMNDTAVIEQTVHFLRHRRFRLR